MPLTRKSLRERRFTILLAALVFVQIVPIITDGPRYRGSSLIWVLVLAAAVHAAGERHRTRLLFAVVAFLGLSGRLASVFDAAGQYQSPVDAGGYVVSALFFAMTIWVVFSAVLAAESVDSDAVLGAICVYLLIGFMWTNLYALVELAEPGSFRFPEYAPHTPDNPEFTFGYYSFVTLTTLGYGDIIPITFRARWISWMEAVVGVTYMATVVGFLVSQLIAGRRGAADGSR